MSTRRIDPHQQTEIEYAWEYVHGLAWATDLDREIPHILRHAWQVAELHRNDPTLTIPPQWFSVPVVSIRLRQPENPTRAQKATIAAAQQLMAALQAWASGDDEGANRIAATVKSTLAELKQAAGLTLGFEFGDVDYYGENEIVDARVADYEEAGQVYSIVLRGPQGELTAGMRNDATWEWNTTPPKDHEDRLLEAVGVLRSVLDGDGEQGEWDWDGPHPQALQYVLDHIDGKAVRS